MHWFLLILMMAKMAATSLPIGIGASGGVFAPSLFIGAMLGSAYGAYGQVMHRLLPGLTAPAGASGLVGMGAIFAGAAQAPITAPPIIFELTGDYAIIPRRSGERLRAHQCDAGHGSAPGADARPAPAQRAGGVAGTAARGAT